MGNFFPVIPMDRWRGTRSREGRGKGPARFPWTVEVSRVFVVKVASARHLFAATGALNNIRLPIALDHTPLMLMGLWVFDLFGEERAPACHAFDHRSHVFRWGGAEALPISGLFMTRSIVSPDAVDHRLSIRRPTHRDLLPTCHLTFGKGLRH